MQTLHIPDRYPNTAHGLFTLLTDLNLPYDMRALYVSLFKEHCLAFAYHYTKLESHVLIRFKGSLDFSCVYLDMPPYWRTAIFGKPMKSHLKRLLENGDDLYKSNLTSASSLINLFGAKTEVDLLSVESTNDSEREIKVSIKINYSGDIRIIHNG